MRQMIFLMFCCGALFACNEKDQTVMGYEPVYGDTAHLYKIEANAPRKVEHGGKIFVSNHLLFQVENGKGIHVTDITNPGSPKKMGFITIAGCQEIAAKGDYLYTNNMNDMVILRQTNHEVKVVKRLPGSFKFLYNQSLPPERGPFVCPDKSKGVVIGWQKKSLINPGCTY